MLWTGRCPLRYNANQKDGHIAKEATKVPGSDESKGKATSFLRKIWRSLCSIKLTVCLLSAIMLISLLGTVFPQVSLLTQTDSAARAQWEADALERYGALGQVFRALGFFNLYASPLFGLLLAALVANGIGCTLNRVRWMWRAIVAKPKAAKPDGFYSKAAHHAIVEVGSTELAQRTIEGLLSRHRYRVLSQVLGGATYLSAHKNDFGRLGTLVTHSALVVMALGGFWTARSAWREPAVVLGPGQLYDVEHSHHFQVRHDGFEIERYPDGSPADYRSHLVVLQDGAQVATKTIRVNDPLTYDGVSFYLSSAGPALQVVGWDKDGNPLPLQTAGQAEARLGQVILNFSGEGGEQSVHLPSLDMDLHVSPCEQALAAVGWEESPLLIQAYREGQDDPLFSDEVHPGDGVQLSTATLQFVADYYTVLQVVSDPGFPPIILGGFFGLTGLLISFHFYPRRVWIRLRNRELALAGAAARNRIAFGAEFSRLVEELRAELQ